MDLQKCRVLVADDNENFTKLIANFLTVLMDIGRENIFCVSNGEEAQRAIEQKHIDLVISDNQMPIMTGVKLLKWIRENEDDRIKKTRFILLTGDEENSIQEAICQYNFNYDAYYCAKPVKLLKLKHLVSRILENP